MRSQVTWEWHLTLEQNSINIQSSSHGGQTLLWKLGWRDGFHLWWWFSLPSKLPRPPQSSWWWVNLRGIRKLRSLAGADRNERKSLVFYQTWRYSPNFYHRKIAKQNSLIFTCSDEPSRLKPFYKSPLPRTSSSLNFSGIGTVCIMHWKGRWWSWFPDLAESGWKLMQFVSRWEACSELEKGDTVDSTKLFEHLAQDLKPPQYPKDIIIGAACADFGIFFFRTRSQI